MENASKALLIAAGVLLMILVLSFATLIVRRIGGQTSDYYKQIQESKISEFNQQFLNFENRELMMQDVVSIINIAKNSNERGLAPVTIVVKLQGEEIQNKSKSDIIEMLTKSLEPDNFEKRYKCTVQYANNSNYVGLITIE